MSFDAPQLTRFERQGFAVLVPEGDIDLAAVPQLKEELEQSIQATQHIVVDLSRTTFLDSSGIGALVSAGSQARDAGGSLRLAAPRDEVLRVLDLTQVNTVLPTYASLDEALAGGPADPVA
ncbi:MAG TPA: STAS domain-containing protein [Dermatophilaceae bacterium]|jgi:anti-sigma B factor antagonist|nr:STAS domain-containing protein [Dermatophilaceae bacterium]